MNPKAKTMLLLLAGAAAAPILVDIFAREQSTKDLAYGLANVGLVGGIIGVGLGLVAVPRLPTWASALILTSAGFGIKLLMLPHGEHGEHEETLAHASEGVADWSLTGWSEGRA